MNNSLQTCLAVKNLAKSACRRLTQTSGLKVPGPRQLPRSNATSMRAWQIERYGSISNVKLQETLKPIISHPNDVLVKISASSINPIDIKMIGGYAKELVETLRLKEKLPWGHLKNEEDRLPLTVGRDFCGEVVGTGGNVKDVATGDRVWGVSDLTRQGSHSEYVVTDCDNVCSIAHSIDDINAASLPYVALTSWSTLTVTACINERNAGGKTVLILGASGGVGSFMSQLLTHWGAEVVGVCSSDTMERVQSYGVNETYDYRDADTEEILTSVGRFDLIVDAANQNDKKWLKGLRSGVGASFVTLMGPLAKNTDENGLIFGLGKSIGEMACSNIDLLKERKFYKWAYYMPNYKALKQIAVLTEKEKIKAVVDKVYSFDEAVSAYRHQANGPVKGKIVLQH